MLISLLSNSNQELDPRETIRAVNRIPRKFKRKTSENSDTMGGAAQLQYGQEAGFCPVFFFPFFKVCFMAIKKIDIMASYTKRLIKPTD